MISNCIPTELLFGNQFIRKFKIHYSYKNNTLYSYLNYNSLINHKNKTIKNKGNYFYLNSLKRKIFKNKFFKRKIKNKFYYKNFSKNRSKNNSKNISKKFNLKNLKNFSKNPKFNKYKNSINKNSKIYVYVKYLNKSKSKFSSKKFNKNHRDLYNNKKEFSYNFLIYCFLSTKDKVEIENEEPKIEEIPHQYQDLAIVFSKKEADKLPPHRLTDCKIVLEKDATLHYGPIYPLTEEESQVLKDYIKENLEKGFIRPSESPAGYPVLFQKKKDGSLRLCVDYKKLNAVTIRNSYPLPLITDIIEKVKGAKYFTKLDLRSAYNLIRIKEGDEYKTAFRTKYGHYEYLVMPFGLKNAPATFQSFINSILRPYLEKCVILYLDDILIYSKDLEEHHNQVRNVLQTLINNNLYAKLEKCEFDQNKVEFLGYILSGDGVSTDPKKIKSVEEWPRPENLKDVQRFIGLCNYYRRFVKDFAKTAKPLHNLTRKNIKFLLTNECEKCF